MVTALSAVLQVGCGGDDSSGKPGPTQVDAGPVSDAGKPAQTGMDAAVDASLGDASVPTSADAGPQIVASLGSALGSLALGGSSLYVSVPATAAGRDGKIVSVPKNALNATSDAGVTVLASGLNQPRDIAQSGSNVYWADTEVLPPASPNVMMVPSAGGAASELLGTAYTGTRIAIANSTLYTITNDLEAIASLPLSGGTATVLFPGVPPNQVVGPDTDGTSVFFFGNASLDLLQLPIAGGTPTVLSASATSGSVQADYLTNDATTVYWSDAASGNIYSIAKSGGSKATLANIASGSAPAQIVLDGDNIYALTQTTLLRLPKTGGTPVLLASVSGAGADKYLVAVANAVALAVDDTYVYWLHEGLGEVLKLPK